MYAITVRSYTDMHHKLVHPFKEKIKERKKMGMFVVYICSTVVRFLN
jgi:hypothetical protein